MLTTDLALPEQYAGLPVLATAPGEVEFHISFLLRGEDVALPAPEMARQFLSFAEAAFADALDRHGRDRVAAVAVAVAGHPSGSALIISALRQG